MRWKVTAAFLSLSFLGGGSLVHFLFKRKKRVNDYKEFLLENTSLEYVRHIKIPKNGIEVINGRQGAVLKDIENKSKTKIFIKNDIISEDFTVLSVMGESDADIERCVWLINEVLKEQVPPQICEAYVPHTTCHGQTEEDGDELRNMSEESKAKINVDTSSESSEQVQLVENEPENEREFQRPNKSYALYRYFESKIKDYHGAEGMAIRRERLPPDVGDMSLEVCVSAFESPDRMSIQILGPFLLELSMLKEEMNNYYSVTKNRKSRRLKKVKLGQIVAAKCKANGEWYRAEVLEIRERHTSDDHEVNLFYVDYGNIVVHKMRQLFLLKKEFLKLRFQAIECKLAKVKPNGSEWSDGAINLLRELTHPRRRYSLVVKVHSYKKTPTGDKKDGIPCVELYRACGRRRLNVAGKMVRTGFAVWDEETTEELDEETTEDWEEETTEEWEEGTTEDSDEETTEELDEKTTEDCKEETTEEWEEERTENLDEERTEELDEKTAEDWKEETTEEWEEERTENLDEERTEELDEEKTENLDEERTEELDEKTAEDWKEETTEEWEEERTENLDEERTEELDEKTTEECEEETTEDPDEDSDEETNKDLDEETLKKSSETDKKRKESDESS